MTHQPGQLAPTTMFNAGVFRCYNNSGEDIPPYSVVKQTGFELGERGEHVLQVGKSDTYGSQYGHFLTGFSTIKAGSYGICQADYAVCKYGGSGTPVVGENWGPIDGQWTLYKRSGGWRILGNLGSNNLVLVQRAPLLDVRVVLDGDLAAGSSATGSVHDDDGDTTYNITVYDRLEMESGNEIVATSALFARWFEDRQKWLATNSDTCETAA